MAIKPQSNVTETIFQRRQKYKTWTELSRQIGFNPGYLYLVAHGKRPASNRLRAALGLPVHVVAVEPCPCGEVHIRATCKQGRKLAQWQRSEEPDFLRFVQGVAVPWMEERREEELSREEKGRNGVGE